VVASPSKLNFTDEKLNHLLRYLREDISRNGNDRKNSVVFYGGEPLLEYSLIRNFIQKSADLDLAYLLFTNGLLIDKVPLDVLNHIDILFISLDGDRESHNKHRGPNTYDVILNNLKKVRGRLKSHIIARITVEEETNIYQSVRNVIHWVDSVYWQIVNKPRFHHPETFLENYKHHLSQLWEYWLSSFERGKLLKLIPFQAVVSSLLSFDRGGRPSFRCGCGSSFQAIDPEGNVYECDEYVGDPKGVVGNIHNGKPIVLSGLSHKEVFKDCKVCDITDICLGRCRKCLKEFSPDQIRNYCELTRHLVKTIAHHLPRIRKIMHTKGLTPGDIYPEPHCTEEIP